MKVLYDKGIFSIEGIAVINPEVLPIETHCGEYPLVLTLGKNKYRYIKNGDEFDLPENIIAEKVQHCNEYHFHGKSSCYVYRLKLKEPLVDTGSKEEILKRRGSLHVINGINFYTTDGIYVAMEEYSSQQLSEYKEKLKAEIKGNAFKTDERNASVITVTDVLTIIDKIQ